MSAISHIIARFAVLTLYTSDIDIVNFYLKGLKPTKVHSFGSIGHFKKSRKPAEAGNAKTCLECPYESKCVWSAKKIYIDTLFDKKAEKVRPDGRGFSLRYDTNHHEHKVGKAFCRF